MNNIIIKVVTDFHPKPYGRYKNDAPGCELTSGQTFREDILAPALKMYDHVTVDLTGYNRYGRSFLDEAFGGLVREEGFSAEEVRSKLSFKHDEVKSIEVVIQDRINAAIKDSME